MVIGLKQMVSAYGYDGTIFYISQVGSSNITGGTYNTVSTQVNELFINNNGTSTVSNIDTYLRKPFANTGTLTLTDVNMKYLSSDWNLVTNGGTLTINVGEFFYY